MSDLTSDIHPKMIWLTRGLTLAGAVPFLIALFLVIFPQRGFDGASLATSYATVIISFLSGTLWMNALRSSNSVLFPLLIKSNFVTLLAWVALLFLPHISALLLHALCFLYLFSLDRQLFKSGHLPEWYYSLRRVITLIVVSLLVLLMGALSL